MTFKEAFLYYVEYIAKATQGNERDTLKIGTNCARLLVDTSMLFFLLPCFRSGKKKTLVLILLFYVDIDLRPVLIYSVFSVVWHRMCFVWVCRRRGRQGVYGEVRGAAPAPGARSLRKGEGDG